MSSMLDKVDVRVAASRLWFGFPHWIVLGWAILISYNVWELVEWRVDHDREGEVRTAAVQDILAEIKKLQQDGIRTRTILELKFPRTAQMVDEAIGDEE